LKPRPLTRITITIPDGDKILIVHRNKDAELRFLDKLSSLHSQFIRPQEGNSLILKGADVLKITGSSFLLIQ
jgi:non-specific serine/threonine protein kinase